MNDSRDLNQPAAAGDAKLTLLSTEHCSLCELALDLLMSMPELRGLTLRVVDVAEDAALLERYGERLPVLRWQGRELDWPFTPQDVTKFLV